VTTQISDVNRNPGRTAVIPVRVITTIFSCQRREMPHNGGSHVFIRIDITHRSIACGRHFHYDGHFVVARRP
jgi:hypothetical protein